MRWLTHSDNDAEVFAALLKILLCQRLEILAIMSKQSQAAINRIS